MTFLPIVERELRVAARRGLTWWGRFAAAAAALVILGAMQALHAISKGAIFSAGQMQFAVLKWLAFLFAGFAGMFLTADCISEEKREGTLGLLFLTDLRGHDVVLGKLVANATRAFYSLLATFPLMGLTLVLGGVSGVEFERVTLAVCNTLFFTISLGLLVSSLSRDALKALNGALLLSAIFLGGLPLADWGLAGWDATKFVPELSLASPGYLFFTTGPLPRAGFWPQLAFQHALGWGFLALASICTPRTWQEKARAVDRPERTFGERWRFGGPGRRLSLRRRFMAKDPLLWLTMRDRWLPRLAWGVCVLGAAVAAALVVRQNILNPTPARGQFLNFASSTITSMISLAMYLWVASMACRFFVDAARNGALELILVTPVGPGQIVRNQWAAIWRTFLAPLLLVLVLETAIHLLNLKEMRRMMAATKTAANLMPAQAFQTFALAIGVVNFVGSLAAMAWCGMWMGLRSRKTSIAVLKTLAFVLVLPWFAMVFVQIAFTMATAFSARSGGTFTMWPVYLGQAASAVVDLGKNIFFIVWSRKKLLTEFREAVEQGGQPPVKPVPPVITGLRPPVEP